MFEIPPADAAREQLPESVLLPLLAIALFYLYAFCQFAAFEVLERTSLLGRPGGQAIVSQALAKGNDPSSQIARVRVGLWASVLGFPLYLVGLAILFRVFRSIPPRDVGLTRRHFVHGILSGFKVGLFLIPLVTGIYLLVQLFFKLVAGKAAEEHPYALLAQSGLTPLEWVLLYLGAVVVAPINEEILFRGVLQRWFLRAPRAGWAGMLGAAAFAALMRWPGLAKNWAPGDPAFWWELAPVLFILILLPHFMILLARGKDSAPAAIFVSSVLFAAFHSFAWPTPVPLLVLGIGLGWLAHRLGTLAGPMVVHALFNGLAFVLLLLGAK